VHRASNCSPCQANHRGAIVLAIQRSGKLQTRSFRPSVPFHQSEIRASSLPPSRARTDAVLVEFVFTQGFDETARGDRIALKRGEKRRAQTENWPEHDGGNIAGAPDRFVEPSQRAPKGAIDLTHFFSPSSLLANGIKCFVARGDASAFAKNVARIERVNDKSIWIISSRASAVQLRTIYNYSPPPHS